jgi:RES domain-containing protein
MSNTVFRSKQGFGAYRIGSSAHPLLDGSGAAASDDARWNSKGRYVIYASEHYATALLEKAAQLNSIKVPRTLVWVRINIPAGTTMEEIRLEDLPDWDADDKEVSQRSAIAGTMMQDRWCCSSLQWRRPDWNGTC